MSETATAIDILAMHAQMSPDKVAVVDEEDCRLTYDELNRRVNRCASALVGLGLQRGDRCLHLHHNRIEAFELGHALRKLQAVTTPVNWRLRGEEIAYLIADSGATAVVVGEEFVDVVDEARRVLADDGGARQWVAFAEQPPPGWRSYEELLAGGVEDEPTAPPQMTGPTMVYTAGTTGRPKGAFRPKGSDVSVVFQYIQEFGLRSDDIHLLAGPGYHSAPAVFSGLQQLIGATTVVLHRFDPERALRLIDRHRVTTTFMAPTLVRRILDLPEAVRAGYDVSSMRALLVGAAPFPADLKRRAQAYFGESVHEFYGSTETGIVSLIKPADLLAHPDSCGRLLDGVEVRFLDDQGHEVPPGRPGELWSRSAALFGEYYGRADATAQSMLDGFFTVGDIAFLDGDGFLHICDRKIDMVISGGVNIYPAEIEGVMGEHPGVEDVAVVGVPDEEWGERLHAVVKRRAGVDVDEAELIALAGSRLASYKRPRSVEFVDELPRDAAGKLLKRLLRERYWAGSGRRV